MTPAPTGDTIDNNIGQAPADMFFDETQGQFVSGADGLAGESLSGAMRVSGARITDPYSSRADDHAKRYYGLVRSMKTDVVRIAKNTGYPVEVIQQIKDFVFMEMHDLGEGRIDRFDADYAMAQSWQRLIAGTPESHDLTLLKHEVMERQLMLEGMTQDEAHRRTSLKYNYKQEADDFYASLEKHQN